MKSCDLHNKINKKNEIKRPELIMARTYSGVLLLITKKIDIFANTNFTT